MSQVKLPQISLACFPTRLNEEPQYNVLQPSSLLTYLGITAVGRNNTENSTVLRSFNAVPVIAYFDIFKNYYANKQEENFYLMDYGNLISNVTAMTAPTGGTSIWSTNTPDRINQNLPDDPNNSLFITLKDEMNREEFESLCEITTNIYSGSPGVYETKTTKVPLTQYYEFYGYASAIKRYIYKWKLGESLPMSPKIFSVTLRKGGLKAQLLEDLDELREEILKTDGNVHYELNASNNVPLTFEWLDTLSRYRDWETDRKSTRLNSSHSAKSRMPSSA